MNQEQCKYYRFGYSGCNYLCINRSVYTQSELLPNGIIREIQCDKDDKWMKVRERKKENEEWNEIDLDGLKHHDIIDLNENGDRWEGDSLNGSPFGYGCIYNSENQLIYSGFIYEGLKVCYGIEVYGDVSLVEYVGGYYNGMRYGNGKLYDKKNELIYEGEWYMNNPLETSSVKIDRELKEEDIHFGLEELEIGDDCLDNIECFKLIGYDRLKKLILHKNRIMRMNCFCIEDCNELVNIELFDNYGKDDYNEDEIVDNNVDDNSESHRVFKIINCKSIKELNVSNNWFPFFDHAELISK